MRRVRRPRACSYSRPRIRVRTATLPRVFAQYVRKDHALSVEQAVRKLTALPADNLSLKDRGRLTPGAFADVVVFDPKHHPGPCNVRKAAPAQHRRELRHR